MQEDDVRSPAIHPNASAEALADLLGQSDEIDQLLVQHPKRADIERIARSASASDDPLAGLSVAYHRANLIRMLKDFVAETGQTFVERLAEQYVTVSRAFSPLTCRAQDLMDASQRTRDLIGGFPYTSDAFPWPRTGNDGLYMQPIVQIDLANAGKVLGLDLGNDLLQVWGPVFASVKEVSSALGKHGTGVLMTRLIPRERLADPPSDFLPDWSKLGDGKSQSEYLMVFESDDPLATQHLVTWGPVLPMYGSAQQVRELAWNLRGDNESPDDDEVEELVEGFVDAVDSSPLVPNSYRDYLGGFGGQTGGEYDPSYGAPLLVRISDSTGFHFAVKCETNGRAGPKFRADFTIRA